MGINGARRTPPFGGHVRDGKPVIHRKALQPISSEFNSMVQDVVIVEQAAKSYDNVLASHTRWQNACKGHLRDWRDLPPRSPNGRCQSNPFASSAERIQYDIPSGPDTGSVSPYHGRSKATHSTIHV